jgi:hypothetical protein
MHAAEVLLAGIRRTIRFVGGALWRNESIRIASESRASGGERMNLPPLVIDALSHD